MLGQTGGGSYFPYYQYYLTSIPASSWFHNLVVHSVLLINTIISGQIKVAIFLIALI